ncbi:MAG: response regulator [Novosphingobium sp.]
MGNDQALVLLIDDVDAIVEELLTFMALHDIAAVGVADLDQAMAMLEQHASIRVLACDVRLGGESGLSIVSRIRTHATLRDRTFRYLFITGDQLRLDPDLALPDHLVLTKPVQPQVLISTLNSMLGDIDEVHANAEDLE